METKMFTCILCKKIRGHILLELLFKDGTPMCSICGDDIRRGFTYYIQGKEISKNEFDDSIQEDKYWEDKDEEKL